MVDTTTGEKQVVKRVRGIDTLRFFLAMWVVFGHLGFIPINFPKDTSTEKVLALSWNNSFSGAAAVIVFFVISGFCIHYPYRQADKLLLVPYFSRRHVRIWVPIIAISFLARPLGVKLTVLQDSVLWSLLAEEIYYLLYPLLFLARKSHGWKLIFVASCVASFMVVLTNPKAGNYPSYGPYLNWLLGLPCWLLGCVLAQKIDALQSIQLSNPTNEIHIWYWRIGAWSLSWVCSVLRYHSPIKYPWTLNLYAVFAFFWLSREILYYQKRKPLTVFERAGKGSYSIYLVHIVGAALYASLHLSISNSFLSWAVMMAFVLLCCYIFYAVIEKPSHFLAKRLSLALTSPQISSAN